MLTQIHIRNLATIEALDLDLPHGSIMVTGETGAGKSIFIEAIELALGGRASANMVRSGKDKMEVSLSFDITRFPKVIALLESLALSLETPECIIRRVITREGKSRTYVNGSPAPLQLTKELGELLFHLHSQHEQQVLLRAEAQREILDRYADLMPLAAEVKDTADSLRSLQVQTEELKQQLTDRQNRIDYLKFQMEELDAVQLGPGEWPILEAEHKRLLHAEEISAELQQVSLVLSTEDNNSLLIRLTDIRKVLAGMTKFFAQADNWLTSVDACHIQLQDLADELRHSLEQCDIDPLRLQQVEDKVSAIYNLARKHKVTPETLVELRLKIGTELSSLEDTDQTLANLEAQAQALVDIYNKLSKQLSDQRQKSAIKLQNEITTTVRSLSLPYADFKIQFEAEKDPFCCHGQERVVFVIKTNPDQSPQPLAKVISGGELSRLSLAAHLALAEKTSIPTLVFDEVDTGLSGAAAEKIGQLLRKLGESFQVFCITHQAQVAALGHAHLVVEKCVIGDRTHSQMRLLTNQEKTQEIARMLGGVKITEKTLAHAEELLQGI